MKEFECKEEGCTAKFHKAKGYCVHHYQKSKYEPRKRTGSTAKASQCEFEGQHSNNLLIVPVDGKVCCTTHYADRIGLIAVTTPKENTN